MAVRLSARLAEARPGIRAAGCSAAWQRASFGTKRPPVQIRPPRPDKTQVTGYEVACVPCFLLSRCPILGAKPESPSSSGISPAAAEPTARRSVVAAPFRTSDTIVSVRLGEAVAVAPKIGRSSPLSVTASECYGQGNGRGPAEYLLTHLRGPRASFNAYNSRLWRNPPGLDSLPGRQRP